MPKRPLPPNRVFHFAAFAATALLLLVVAWDSWYVTKPGERVVVFNRVTGELESTDEGLHFKLPILQTTDAYNVRGQLYQATAWGASRDLQDVHAEVAIQYHPERGAVEKLHLMYGTGYADVLLAPAVQEVVKSVTARYNADQLISERVQVKSEIVAALRERMSAVDVRVEQVDIKDFDFSESFNAAIEAKVTQQQKALEEQNRLEQVRYQALQTETSAQGRANATRIEAQAQADAARIITEQLSRDPTYLEYIKLQRWNGELPRVTGESSGISLLVNTSG